MAFETPPRCWTAVRGFGTTVSDVNEPIENLLARHGTTAETLLPEDPAAAEILDHGKDRFLETVRNHPDSSLCWALLAEGALTMGTPDAEVTAYAYARTGYHRGLDTLRRSGWKGAGPIPWEHGPNRGFLRALWALAVAAERLGEEDEAARCTQFLRDSSETAYTQLRTARPAQSSPAPESGAETTASADRASDRADRPDGPPIS